MIEVRSPEGGPPVVRMQASSYAMVEVQDAIRTILEHTPVLDAEVVALDDADGRVLAEAIFAADDMPPFAASSVDGYAVRSEDGAAPRRVLSEITAGGTETATVEPG